MMKKKKVEKERRKQKEEKRVQKTVKTRSYESPREQRMHVTTYKAI